MCTGALEDGTHRIVRIHPVPARYLDPGQRFAKFQWIRARVRNHENDPRPDSLRIDASSIELGEEIPAERAEERIRLLEASPQYMRSVEELQRRQKTDKTSLAVIRPKEITGISLGRRSDAERKEWVEKERELLSQTTLEFMRPPKPIDFPEVRFQVEWVCDDQTCSGHKMGLEQWGLHELSRRLRDDADHDRKIIDLMTRELDLVTRDVFMFLGSFRTIMWNFGLMDVYSPKRKRQMTLF
ncbi:MAG: hypothetical protein M5U28_52775 [Sandaracinaceae bacterium]|nr:hypothetical protein [Sandaracinaceae bacterium]